MGMYTELVIKTPIKENIPEEVEAVLQHMFNDGEYPTVLPDHPFFELHRWNMIGSCSSFYHIPWATSKYEKPYGTGYLFSRSDLKDYDGEIDAFIDWITPYVDNYRGGCIGWKWYEEWDKPELIII